MGSQSGVNPTDECISKFNELKLAHAYRYIIFKLNDKNTEIVVEKTGPASAKWQEFVAALPQDDCRYGVFDFEFTVEDGGAREKIVFVLWSADAAKIKSKMLYTSSKDALKKRLNLLGNDIQATDAGEIAYEVVLDKVKTFTK